MKKYFVVCIAALALAACHSSETPNTPQSQAQQTANSAQKVMLIDVRSPEEFQQGHLAHAHNIVHDQIEQHMAHLPSDKNAEIHVYCRSGRRSAIALETLNKMGYTNVKNLGAYDDLKNHYPIEK